MSIPGSASPLFFGAGAGEAAAFQIDRSLRFNSGDSAHLSRTPSSAGNGQTWTWSGWVKRVKLGADTWFFRADSGFSTFFLLGFGSNHSFYSSYTAGVSAAGENYTAAVFRDTSAWYHMVFAFDTTQATATDRVKMYVNGVQQTLTVSNPPAQNSGYQVNSTNLHRIGGMSGSYADFYLTEINFVDGQALDPTSFGEYDDNNVWQPKDTSGLTFGTNGFRLKFDDNSSNAALGNDSSGNDNDWTVNNISAAGSAWNQSQTWSSSLSSSTGFRGSEPATNAFDGDTSTICSAVNNGVVTFTSPVTFASDSTIRVIVHGGDHTVTVNGGSNQTISAGSYQTVSFTNSSNSTFTMTFQRDASADTGIRAIEIGGNVLVDSSVVDPDAEEIDSLIDTPTNYTASSGNNGGNYATLNPLDFASSGSPTLKNGNLDAEAGSGWQTVAATIGNLTSGKWYWEVKLGGGSGHRTGLSSVSRSNASASDLLGSGDIALNSADGRVYVDGTEVGTGAGNLSGKTVGIALNLDANSVSFYQNNSLVHTVSSLSSTASWTPVHATRYSVVDHLNFGQRSFAYTPPTGFLSLCTTNLPDPTIADGSTVFDAVAYSGNGGTQSITGVNFSPDFLWFKRRQSPTRLHMLYDTVRGASGDKVLKSDSTGDESWDTSTYGQLDSADSNGFTVTDGSNTDDNINSNNDSYIAWLWDAGTSTVSNTDGDITSSVRANQTAGFSIVTYTGNGTDGATVGHGLNDNVALYFMKNRSSTANWAVLGHALNDAFGGSQKYLQLNTQIAAGTAAQGPGDSSTIELHTDSTNNTNGDNYVAYCFAAVEGYSAFGHYVSNNDANGPFVYLGFQAKLIMWKNLDGAHGWYIYDDTRDPDNPMSKYLAAHSNIAEGDPGGEMDVLSNGFKVRNTGADMNRDSHKILYMAWAEHPFKTARAR